MNLLDKYKLNNKINNLGSLVWNLLISLNKVIIGLFLLITCIIIWENLGIYLLDNGIDLLKEISIMIFIVIISSILISIDFIIKLNK
jgi:hypothetical protein